MISEFGCVRCRGSGLRCRCSGAGPAPRFASLPAPSGRKWAGRGQRATGSLLLTSCAAARALAALAWAASSCCCRAAASASAALASAAAWALAAALGSSALSPWKVLAKALPAMVPTTAPTAAPATVPIMPEPALAAGAAAVAAGAGAAAALAGAAGVAAAGRWAAAGAAGAAGLAGALLTAAGRAMGFFAPPRRLAWATEGMAKAAIVTARTEAVARREVVVIRITFFGVREDLVPALEGGVGPEFPEKMRREEKIFLIKKSLFRTKNQYFSS